MPKKWHNDKMLPPLKSYSRRNRIILVGGKLPAKKIRSSPKTLFQTKHHWWWKTNRVFNGLDITKNFHGSVLFIEVSTFVVHFNCKSYIKLYHYILSSSLYLLLRCTCLHSVEYLYFYIVTNKVDSTNDLHALINILFSISNQQ